ncbi:hypothetical protein QVD99_000513 [Batrachochytrium dendrobatidis]|nr:hypothetical protein QVD99_000513 [Batrachochytrium dendrobatidis]
MSATAKDLVDRILAANDSGTSSSRTAIHALVDKVSEDQIEQEILHLWINANSNTGTVLCQLLKVKHRSIQNIVWKQLVQFLVKSNSTQKYPSADVLIMVTKTAINNLSEFELENCVEGLAQIVGAFHKAVVLDKVALELMSAMMVMISNVRKLVLEVDSITGVSDENTEPRGQEAFQKVSGSEYKSTLLGCIFSSVWLPASNALNIISVLTDVEMTFEETKMFTRKVIECFPAISDHDKPNIAHTLILLSKKGEKSMILSTLSKMLFDWFSSVGSTESVVSRHIIGSILTNISFAIRNDQSLCEEFTKWIRNDHTRVFINYNFALLLLIVHVPQFETATLDLILASMKVWLEAVDCTRNIHWLSDVMNMHSYNFELKIATMLDPDIFGGSGVTDQIVSALLKLGCCILDSPNSATKRKGDAVQQKRLSMANTILVSIFKSHAYMQNIVLECLFDRMLFKSDASIRAIAVFEQLCHEKTLMCQYLTMIKEMVNNIYAMPEDVRKRFISAVSPLIVCDRSIFDSTMLVLRKGSFQRELAFRETALNGLLNLLVSIDKLENNLVLDHTTKFELIGYLRRFLSQQADIRDRLYTQMLSIVCTSPSLTDTILSIVWTQLSQYLEPNGEGLKFDLCYSKKQRTIEIIEPLGVLFHTLSVILSKESALSNTSDIEHAAMMDTLLRVISTFTKLHLEDLPLEEMKMPSNVEIDSDELENRQLRLQMMIGVYEAMLGHCFLHGDGLDEWSEFVVSLFKRLRELKGVQKDFFSKNRFGYKEKRVPCVLSFQICAPIICKIFESSHSSSEMGIFIFAAASNQLNLMSKDLSTFNNDNFFTESKCMANIIYRTFLSDGAQIVKCDKKLLILAIDCFERCYTAIHLAMESRLSAWLTYVLGLDQDENETINTDNSTATQDSLTLGVSSLSALKIPLKELLAHGSYSKQALALFRCISLLLKKFPVGTNTIKEWLMLTIFRQSIVDVNMIKEVFELFLQNTCLENDSALLQKILTETAREFGEIVIDEDLNEDEQPQLEFPIVCQETATPISMCILGFLETSLEQIEWCFVHCTSFSAEPEMIEASLNERLMSRFVKMITMIGELENACVPVVVSDLLLRCIAKTYRLLTIIAKMRLKDVSSHLSPGFIQLVKTASVGLTQRLYSLIPYLQQRDGELLQTKKKNKEKQQLGSDTKMIPNVIYHIEQYERHLIQLSKRSKVDLGHFIKRSTARDFRIQIKNIEVQDKEHETISQAKRARLAES